MSPASKLLVTAMATVAVGATTVSPVRAGSVPAAASGISAVRTIGVQAPLAQPPSSQVACRGRQAAHVEIKNSSGVMVGFTDLYHDAVRNELCAVTVKTGRLDGTLTTTALYLKPCKEISNKETEGKCTLADPVFWQRENQLHQVGPITVYTARRCVEVAGDIYDRPDERGERAGASALACNDG